MQLIKTWSISVRHYIFEKEIEALKDSIRNEASYGFHKNLFKIISWEEH